LPTADDIRIVVAEDSQAGHQLWSILERELADLLAPRTLTVTIARSAGELLSLLDSLERSARRPDMVLLDLHIPVRSGHLAAGMPTHSLPHSIKTGVWLAKHIRAGGNDTSTLVLWTSNVLANELNDAYAFCNLDHKGRPLGDYVIDKVSERQVQVESLAALLDADGDSKPSWAPPEPAVALTSAPHKSLPYLELGMRSKAIAEALVLSKKTVDDHKAILRDSLCGEVSGGDRELSVAIVTAARRAGIPWIPLQYEDPENDPLSVLSRGR